MAFDRNGPDAGGAVAVLLAESGNHLIADPAAADVVERLPSAFDLPGNQQTAAVVFRLEFVDAGFELGDEGVFVGASGDFDGFGDPAKGVGGDEAGFDLARIVDRDDCAAVGFGFVGGATLGRTAVVGDAGGLVDGLAVVLAAEGHVVDAITLSAGRGGGAVGDANGEQSVGVAVETAVVEGAALVAADALDLGDGRAVAADFKFLDLANGENVDISGQWEAGGPRFGGVDVAAGPIDGDVVVSEALELFLQEYDGAGANQIDVEDVAGKQQGVGPLGKGGLEDLGGRLKGGV